MGRVYAAYDKSLDRGSGPSKCCAPNSPRTTSAASASSVRRRPSQPSITPTSSPSTRWRKTTAGISSQCSSWTARRSTRSCPAPGCRSTSFSTSAVRLAEAVSAAHQKGIVHRDLKATNVMVAKDGQLKILDFGLAKLRDVGVRVGGSVGFSMELTLDGQIIGTVAYHVAGAGRGTFCRPSLGHLLARCADVRDGHGRASLLRRHADFSDVVDHQGHAEPGDRHQTRCAAASRPHHQDLPRQKTRCAAIRAPSTYGMHSTTSRTSCSPRMTCARCRRCHAWTTRRRGAAGWRRRALGACAAIVAVVLLVVVGIWFGRTLGVGEANGNRPFNPRRSCFGSPARRVWPAH